MAYQIRFEEQAKKELSALDNSVKIKILKFLRKLEDRKDPRSLGKPLTANLSRYWRYRVGNYRIICKIVDKEIIILILAVQHRSTVYKISNKF
ncbi:type II toxin-antitoxin system RelE/ParE family toxin [uncultured Sphaerochaeta sp.]|uniref:type II toxin-antitoxin system RelE family toxin n=1 Tax=uncultured Sphaerochaeta sp. TaxID=886478 RepID=UPI002AA85D37|nr:type II toxin-antitoxin system RelE/ParE family toxin [uncultured Sphaerochaeta sp.]